MLGRSGAWLVVVVTARDGKYLAMGVVTKPFVFKERKGCSRLRHPFQKKCWCVDFVRTVTDNTQILDDFLVKDYILQHGLFEILEIITNMGSVNDNFSDV